MSQQRPPKESAHYQFVSALSNLPLLTAEFKTQCFSKHVHEGYCIGVIEQGAQRFYRSGGHHIASENCIILVNADQLHDGQTATESGWKYQAIYPLEHLFSTLLTDMSGSASLPFFKAPVVSDRELANELRQLFELFSNSQNVLQIEAFWYQVTGKLVQRHAGGLKNTVNVHRDNGASQLICEYLNANLSDSVTTAELAALTGRNPYYLIRSFQKTMGLPPHAWQIQRRLQKATALLKTGLSATDAGQTVGFNDQSHFTRHFLRMWGTTPGRFQKAWRQ